MAYGIQLHVWGAYACFTRPEMKVERVSYDVITPSAARGLLEAIYWKPQMRWIIRRIHVLRPVRFTSVRRNELSQVIPLGTVKKAMQTGRGGLGIAVEEHRQQRASLLLRDVAYLIEAEIVVLDSREADGSTLERPEAKHLDSFKRRAREGKYFHHPYFGCREFPVDFRLIEEGEAPPGSELPASERDRDLGFMLHDIDFVQDARTKKVKSATPRFFRAELRGGVIEVPPFEEARG